MRNYYTENFILDNGTAQIHKPLSLKEWFGIVGIALLPLIGFIMLFLWAYDGKAKPAKAYWARVMLIGLISLTLIVLLSSLFVQLYMF
jgi:hypothetical protein